MKNTEHLELSLPEGNDYVNIEALNENWRKIDAAFPELIRLIEGRAPVAGSYVGTGEFTGTGSAVTEGATTLHFPSTPEILIIQSTNEECRRAFVALRGIEGSVTTNASGAHAVYLSWGDDTVVLQTYSNHTDFKGYSPIFNKSGVTYRYIAFL